MILSRKGHTTFLFPCPEPTPFSTWTPQPTPIGEYNPDWAIVMQDRDEHVQPTGEPAFYGVRETKSTTNLDELRLDERRRTLCGQRHFRDALGLQYGVVTDADELP
jgi:type III restriction enzyme